MSVETEIQFKARDRVEDRQFDVFARYNVTATADDDPELEAWRVRVEHVATYRKRDDESIAEDDGVAFSAIIGLVNIHPFAREAVQSAVQRMGYPPFTLDMLEPLSAFPDDHVVELDN